MVSEYTLKLIDRGLLQRKLREYTEIAEEVNDRKGDGNNKGTAARPPIGSLCSPLPPVSGQRQPITHR